MNGKAPRMSKKHFEYIADAIHNDWKDHRENPEFIEKIASALSWHLCETNDQFDRERFIDRCLHGKNHG